MDPTPTEPTPTPTEPRTLAQALDDADVEYFDTVDGYEVRAELCATITARPSPTREHPEAVYVVVARESASESDTGGWTEDEYDANTHAEAVALLKRLAHRYAW